VACIHLAHVVVAMNFSVPQKAELSSLPERLSVFKKINRKKTSTILIKKEERNTRHRNFCIEQRQSATEVLTEGNEMYEMKQMWHRTSICILH
jgi:hypothetical protein